MVHQRYLPATALLLILGAARVQALGLGALNVESALNSPLEAYAEVESGASARDGILLRARSATPGVPELTAALVTDGDRVRVRISTARPVREPVLSLQLTLENAGTAVTRAYDILLDPPADALRRVLVTAAQAAPVVVSAPAAPRRNESTRPVLPTGRTSTYKTRPNDSLWKIAKALRPAGISQQQAMDALITANTDAFVGGDPNRIRVGESLVVPWFRVAAPAEHQTAAVGSASDAASVGAPPAVDNGTVDATTPATTPVARLAAPATAATVPAAGVGAAPAVAKGALESETLASKPAAVTAAATSGVAAPGPVTEVRGEASRLEAENTVMRGRIDRLEDQIVALRDEIARSDALMAELRALAAAKPAAAPTATRLPDSPAQARPKAVEAKTSSAPPRSGVDVAATWFGLPLIGIATAVVTLALLALALQRLLAQHRAEREAAAMVAARREREQSVRATLSERVRSMSAKSVPVVSNVESETPPTVQLTESPLTAKLESRVAEEDAYSALRREVDLHVAYGQFDLAEGTLREALISDPNNYELRLKLAEVYYFASKAQPYIALVRELEPDARHLPGDGWLNLIRMGSEIAPQHPLFRTARADSELPEPPVTDRTETLLPPSVLEFAKKRASGSGT